jgi:hypothetical protein
VADSGPLLSVIITSYAKNRLPDVFDLLESLKAQTYGHIEIVFVGEREPELCEQVKDYADQQGMRSVIVLFNDGEPGLSAGRNVAIPRAKGEIIAFLDDDVVAFPDWAEMVVSTFAKTDAIGLTGPALPLWEDPSMAWFPEELYWVISCTAWSGWEQEREVRNAWGMNMAFRREAFTNGLRFSDAFGLRNSSRLSWIDPPSEDVDFSLRAQEKTGKKIIFSPKARVWHKIPRKRIGVRFVVQRSASVGFQRRMLEKLYPKASRNSKPLEQERQLLMRILTGLFPRILGDLFLSPWRGWKELRITLVSLLFVALGYYCLYPACRLDSTPNEELTESA